MNVRVKIEFGSPCVKDQDVSDLCPKVLRLRSKLSNGRLGRMIHCVIQEFLIVVNQGIKFLRHSEHHMEIRSVKNVLTS